MEAPEDSDTRVEEQGVTSGHQSQLLLGGTDAHQSVCCRIRWKAGQQSGSREGERILQRHRVVDDSRSTSHIHKLYAVVSSMQTGAAVSEPAHDISTHEIPFEYDLLQPLSVGRSN